MKPRISEAKTAAAIARCFPVMRQLRPHFEDGTTFVAQVERQQRDGYRMAFAESEGIVRAVAGYRSTLGVFATWMIW